jgi:secretion system chaperone SscA
MTNSTPTPSEAHFIDWYTQLAKGDNPYANVTEEKIQEMHGLAYLHYQKKNYFESGNVYRLLAIARPSEAKYWKGLGACLQLQQQYQEALDCYLSAQILNKKAPDPHLYLHAADCYFGMNQIKSGLNALAAAQARAKELNDGPIIKHVKLMREFWVKPKPS